jgi:hypothetical protein
MAQLMVLKEAAAHEHEAPLRILGVEADARQMVEERVKMGIRMHLAQPSGTLTHEMLQADSRGASTGSARRIWHSFCRHASLNAGLLLSCQRQPRCHPRQIPSNLSTDKNHEHLLPQN